MKVKTFIGLFTTDNEGDIKGVTLFKRLEDYDKIKGKFSPKILSSLKDKQYFAGFRQMHTELAMKKVAQSVKWDNFLINSVALIEEVDKSVSMFSRRLYEWYGLYDPELTYKISDNIGFAKAVIEGRKPRGGMAAPIPASDIAQAKELAQEILGLDKLRQRNEKYITKLMKKYCPNILAICGHMIGARLIQSAGGLRRLAILPSSTIQLLGAEKALFRHLTRKAKAPKHGLIVAHPLVSGAERSMRGKVSRALADKIGLCARLDFFKGEFKGEEYRKELENRFNIK